MIFGRAGHGEGTVRAILLAAAAAPVGSRLYKDIHLTVIQDKEILRQLSLAAAKRYADREKIKEIIIQKPGAEDAGKVYDPFYGAPTVIFVSHRNQTLQPGIEFSNAACVTYSMHLAATELGLGSVFMWLRSNQCARTPNWTILPY